VFGVTVGEWIDGCARPVPDAFRSRLNAEGPASLDVLIAAAEAELRACAGGAARDRASAFSLLAADAYITYACLWAITEGSPGDLRRIAGRISRAWTGENTA